MIFSYNQKFSFTPEVAKNSKYFALFHALGPLKGKVAGATADFSVLPEDIQAIVRELIADSEVDLLGFSQLIEEKLPAERKAELQQLVNSQDIYSRLVTRRNTTQEKLRAIRQQQKEQETAGCTFIPSIIKNYKPRRSNK